MLLARSQSRHQFQMHHKSVWDFNLYAHAEIQKNVVKKISFDSRIQNLDSPCQRSAIMLSNNQTTAEETLDREQKRHFTLEKSPFKVIGNTSHCGLRHSSVFTIVTIVTMLMKTPQIAVY